MCARVWISEGVCRERKNETGTLSFRGFDGAPVRFPLADIGQQRLCVHSGDHSRVTGAAGLT